MSKDRFLFIGIRFIHEAAKHSKRKLEAFGFAVTVKSNFQNSKYYLKSYTYTEISKVCQISEKKAKQILIDVVKFGYAKWNENGTILEFAKIRSSWKLSYKFSVSQITNKTINSQFTKDNDTNIESLSLDMVVNELRKILILNHIQKENYIHNTKIGFADEKNLSKAKKMRKAIEKYAIDINSKDEGGISLESLMDVVNIKNRNKIVLLMNDLIGADLIEKKKNIIFVGMTNINLSYKSNEFGAFFTYKNKLYQVLRNIYTLKDFNKIQVCYK